MAGDPDRPGPGRYDGLIVLMLLLLSGGLSQAVLEPQLCQRGKVLLVDDFEDLETVPGRWFFREQWTVAKGRMIRTAVPGENQRVFIKKPRYGNCIIELKVAFQGAGEIRVMTGTPGKYNAVVTLWPRGFRVTTARDQAIPHFPAIHGECAHQFEQGRFYPVMIEIHGEEILVRVGDEKHVVVGRHPILARERDYFALQVDQPGAAFDEVRLVSASGRTDGWPAARGEFEKLQAQRPWLPHEAAEQQKIREMIARDQLYRGSEEFRGKVARVEECKAAAARQFPEVFRTVKERRKDIAVERKRLTAEDPAYRALRDAINKLKRAEIDLLHLLHPGLKELSEAQYHAALARARFESREATALQMVVANQKVMAGRMRIRYPQLEKTNEDLLAEGRAARAKVAGTPGFKQVIRAVAEAVQAEKEAVMKAAESLVMVFAEEKTNQ